jgi:predicted HAD superfamily phosphohydrolase YqeG
MGIKDTVVNYLVTFFIVDNTKEKKKINYYTISFIFQMKNKLKKVAHKAIKKKVAKKGLKGEADRFIGNKMPKHLFAGKRSIGKTDRR